MLGVNVIDVRLVGEWLGDIKETLAFLCVLPRELSLSRLTLKVRG